MYYPRHFPLVYIHEIVLLLFHMMCIQRSARFYLECIISKLTSFVLVLGRLLKKNKKSKKIKKLVYL